MHRGVLGAYPAIKKAVLYFPFGHCFLHIPCFPYSGTLRRERQSVRAELERVFVWVPPEADP